MQKYTFLDFEDNGPKWTTIEIGKPGEILQLIELTEDEEIVVISNKRSVYKSSDQGVTWIDQGQMGRLQYWNKRVNRWWQNRLIILNWLIGRVRLWWLARNYDRRFNR